MLARMPEPAFQDELDSGLRKRGSATERFCAVTREVKPVDELIRFALGPEGIVPDIKRKLPGRGLWISADRTTLEHAVARNVFARGFKRDIRVTPDLVQQTEQLLVQATLDALAIAGKSGLVAAGFSKAEAALARKPVVALLHASEAAADGIAKLRAALRQRPDAEQVAVVTAFSSAQLDLALGRTNVVHASLLAGPASDSFLARFARLRHFRNGEKGEAAKAAHGTDRIRNRNG
jgi:predicted RNA-binding protein YlxR (DUF448 family)